MSIITRKAEVVSFKAIEPTGTGDNKGEVEAIVSVFGNTDRSGEKVLPGAFEQDLEEWKSSGDPIPFIWAHQWDNPLAHLGKVLAAEELKAGDERLPERVRDLGGLYIKAEVDPDLGEGQVNTFALAVSKGLRQRTIKEFSFAYRVNEETKEEDGSRGLKRLGIVEVGPCLKGVNQMTQLIGAKAEKSWVPLAGTIEEKQNALREAIQSWTADSHGERSWSYLDGTFEDRVVFTVEVGGDDPKTVHYEATYTTTEGGEAVLGEPREVDLQVTVSPAEKAEHYMRFKAGRVLSKSNEDKLAQAATLITEVISSVKTSVSTEEAPPKGEKADAPAGPSSEAPTGNELLDPSVVLTSLELDLIEATL